MNHMVLDCPHCQTSKITLDVIGQSENHKMLGDFTAYWNIFLTCRHCSNGVVAVLANQYDEPIPPPLHLDGDPQGKGYVLVRTFPEQLSPVIPEHLSMSIAEDFEEAVDNLSSARYMSAGMMFRRVLQRSTTDLMDNPSILKGKDLKKRIDILADKGVITPAMQEWANIIRLEGNSANHDEEEFGQDEFTPEDAAQLHYFTELFLIYAFTLPARVKQYHEQSTPSAETSGA